MQNDVAAFLSEEALILEQRSNVFFSITSVKSPIPVTNMNRNAG